MNRATTPIGRPAGDLRTLVEEYLTNGKYDPRKSQNRAESYKNAQLTVEERRRIGNQKRTQVIKRFTTLVDGIKVPTNEEHYHSLRKPLQERRHDVKKHQRNLRTPNALMQTNKLKDNGIRKTRYSNSKLQLPKPVSGRNLRQEQASSQPCTS